jgi:DNA-binding transcriptional regulator YhcF (GntR family)
MTLTLAPAAVPPDSPAPSSQQPVPAPAPAAFHAVAPWRPLRSSDLSLVDQLVEHYGGLIRHHGLRTGARLPSVRGLAQEAGVSRDTVVQAYDRLAAQGLVHSRRGSGVFVSAQRAAQAAPRPSDALPVLEQGAAFDKAA